MVKSERVRYVSTFRAPTEYEQRLAEARRREALAQALEQQAYQPMEGAAAPIPRAAPLVKALQSFMAAREGRKAREAAEEAKGLETEYAERMLGRMQGGYTYQPDTGLEQQMAKRPEETLEQYNQRMAATPFTAKAAAVPDQTELGEVTRQSQYRRSPEELLGMASTSLGTAALKERPVMAQRLAQMLETPKTEKFGTTPVKGKGGKYYLASESGRLVPTDVEVPEEEMTPYQKKQVEIEEERLRFQKSKAGQAEGRGKAPSGYRYDENGELEPIPGGPQDPTRPMNMPATVRTQIVNEQNNSRQFAIASQRTNKFIKDIQDGKLPLYKGAGAIYAAERMFGGDEVYDEENRPAYDRYYELERFVTEQVNMILSNAKGPQTDQDAVRAKQQILDNPDNKQIVTTALKTLDRLWNDEISLSESTIDDWYSQYNQKRKDKDDGIIDLPSRGYRRGRRR
jgi:hypothetical protein